MLSKDVFVAANVCQDAWTDVCCQTVKQRVDQVSKSTTHHTLNTQPMQYPIAALLVLLESNTEYHVKQINQYNR